MHFVSVRGGGGRGIGGGMQLCAGGGHSKLYARDGVSYTTSACTHNPEGGNLDLEWAERVKQMGR